MLDITAKLISSFIQSITVFVFVMTILQHKGKIITLKNLLCFLGLTALILIAYGTKYSTLNPIIIFLAIAVGLTAFYKIGISKSFICAGLFMMTLFLSDVIGSVFFVKFLEISEIRSNSFYLILGNTVVSIMALIIIKIHKIKKYFIELIKLSERRKEIETISFIILLIVALSFIVYIISENYSPNKIFFFDVVALLMFLILGSIFFKEKYEKEKMIDKYDQLFEYVSTFEDWFDTGTMQIHESKNQLITLRGIVKRNKKATEYIDNIVKENIIFENKNITVLKNVPKGGLKGLLYYKIIMAENNKINVCVDISNKVKSNFEKLNVEENKILCRLVGIIFDNAIEASKDTKVPTISCEIYLTNNDINIVISNSYQGKIDLNKIAKRGYSTKGKNRGKGLYLAKKYSERSESFTLESRVINNYYIQKIIIKNKNIN